MCCVKKLCQSTVTVFWLIEKENFSFSLDLYIFRVAFKIYVIMDNWMEPVLGAKGFGWNFCKHLCSDIVFFKCPSILQNFCWRIPHVYETLQRWVGIAFCGPYNKHHTNSSSSIKWLFNSSIIALMNSAAISSIRKIFLVVSIDFHAWCQLFGRKASEPKRNLLYLPEDTLAWGNPQRRYGVYQLLMENVLLEDR